MFEYKVYKNGFKAKVIETDRTIRGDREYFRVSLPIDLLLTLDRTNYYGSEEILPGEILLFISDNKKTKLEDGFLYLENLFSSFLNVRDIDIESFKGRYGELANGIYTPIDFIEVNIYLANKEDDL